MDEKTKLSFILGLVLLVTATGCTWLEPSDLQRLDQTYQTEYTLGMPAEMSWKAMAIAVDRRQPVNVLVFNERNRIIAWTEHSSWSSCNQSIRGSFNPTALALTVAYLRPGGKESRLSVRTSCYLTEESSIEHGGSMGFWEREFVSDVHTLGSQLMQK